MGEDAAPQEAFQLPADMRGKVPARRVGVDLLEERRHVFAHGTVQLPKLGATAAIAIGLRSRQSAGESGHGARASNRRADRPSLPLIWAAASVPEVPRGQWSARQDCPGVSEASDSFGRIRTPSPDTSRIAPRRENP